MLFNLSLEDKNNFSCSEMEDGVVADDLFIEDQQEASIAKFESLRDSINKLPANEQIVVFNFLKEDLIFRDIIGDDPKAYLDNLNKYEPAVTSSQEVIGILAAYAYVAYATRFKGVLSDLDKYRNKPITNTFDHDLTRDVRIVPPKVLIQSIQNCKKTIAYLNSSLKNIDKFKIDSLLPYYNSIGLRIPDKHVGWLISGSLLEFLGIVTGWLTGGIAASFLFILFMGMGFLPAVIISAVAGNVVMGGVTLAYNKSATSIRNRDYTTAAQRGWDKAKLQQTTGEFYKLLNDFQNLDVLMNNVKKSSGSQYKKELQAIKRLYKVVFVSLKGSAKSLKVLYNSVTSEYGQ